VFESTRSEARKAHVLMAVQVPKEMLQQIAQKDPIPPDFAWALEARSAVATLQESKQIDVKVRVEFSGPGPAKECLTKAETLKGFAMFMLAMQKESDPAKAKLMSAVSGAIGAAKMEASGPMFTVQTQLATNLGEILQAAGNIQEAAERSKQINNYRQ